MAPRPPRGIPKSQNSRSGAFFAAILLALAPLPSFAQKKDDESDLFFRAGQIPRLVIELDDAACEALRKEGRKYAGGNLRENDRAVFPDIKVKLKGAAGSFREFDDWPSFTVRVDAGDKDQKWHGLRKFHLNKSPQDGTYLHELIGSELFRAAGLLAPRIGHARVWVNKRDMGLYVVKEGFDRLLLKRGFANTAGNLYDGGFCQDIDADLEKDEGKNKDDRADLKKLLEAAREPDMVKRWKRLEELVDIRTFITYMAMELMLGHWDGYCQNRNNYRLYFDPEAAKAVWIPHGMDQLFGDAGASILENPVAIVANAVMKNPAWRAEYRKRIGELMPLFNADKLKKRVDEVAKRLQPVLEAWDKEQARNHQNAVTDLKARLEARERSLKEQKGQPDPRPLVFVPDQPVKLARWRTNSECEDATLATDKVGNAEVMTISTGKSGRCVASWRRSVLVPAGKYRFHALIQAKEVEALADDPNVGGGLRISGSGRENKVLGTSEFKPVTFEFEVQEEAADIELVIELRASKGSIAVRSDSVWLARLSK